MRAPQTTYHTIVHQHTAGHRRSSPREVVAEAGHVVEIDMGRRGCGAGNTAIPSAIATVEEQHSQHHRTTTIPVHSRGSDRGELHCRSWWRWLAEARGGSRGRHGAAPDQGAQRRRRRQGCSRGTAIPPASRLR